MIDHQETLTELADESLESLCALPGRPVSCRGEPLRAGCDLGARISEPQSPPIRSYSDFQGCAFAWRDIDLTSRVETLLQFFADFAGGTPSRDAEHRFLESVHHCEVAVRQAGAPEWATALRAAGDAFQIVHDSPLDFDAHLLSVVWDHLLPALEHLRVAAPPTIEPLPAVVSRSGETLGAKVSTESPARRGPAPQLETRFVRVNEAHLDRFVEHVSRMFITGERFRDVQSRMAQTRQLADLVEEFRQITMDLKVESVALQHAVMAVRRVSIGPLLSKFPEMARKLATQLNKRIEVHLSGEDTEVDEQLAEDLDASLAQLVRSVIDQGIETPDQRKLAGKDEIGQLYLEAKADRRRVAVILRDDGRGIDAQRLIAQGVEMEAVRATLVQHRGEVSVDAAVGRGTTVRMEFPIRQATLVIDGLMVEAGCEPFVIPFEHIKEVVRIEAGQVHSAQGHPVATIRNATYDVVHLAELVGVAEAVRPTKVGEMAVLVECRNVGLCIRVDQIIGHRQVVVTPMGELLPASTRLAGVAQLGGGKLASVLNVTQLLQRRAS